MSQRTKVAKGKNVLWYLLYFRPSWFNDTPYILITISHSYHNDFNLITLDEKLVHNRMKRNTSYVNFYIGYIAFYQPLVENINISA